MIICEEVKKILFSECYLSRRRCVVMVFILFLLVLTSQVFLAIDAGPYGATSIKIAAASQTIR